MIGDLLPAEVAAAEAFGDPTDVVLFASEEAVIARAVAKRRQEFATVRHCARTALARLGHPPAPVLPGRRGAPQWPQGVVGSMTHCAGYRAAAVALSSRITALGIDAEPDEPLPSGVLDTIARPEETAQVTRLAATHDRAAAGVGAADGLPASWERLLFSCKESVFKTWYPLTGLEFGFDQASISFQPDDRTFTAELLVDPGTPLLPRQLVGRWTAGSGLVVSAITVPSARG